MSRLIDADALIDELGIGKDCNECKYNQEPYCKWKPDVVSVCETICTAPTIESEPKTGKWMWQTGDVYRCSECNVDVHVAECMGEPIYNFCPYCSAKMIGYAR